MNQFDHGTGSPWEILQFVSISARASLAVRKKLLAACLIFG